MDYSTKEEVEISLEGCLREVLKDFLEEKILRAKTPAATHLFEIWSGEEQILLDEKQDRAFCHSVAHLLFTSKGVGRI